MSAKTSGRNALKITDSSVVKPFKVFQGAKLASYRVEVRFGKSRCLLICMASNNLFTLFSSYSGKTQKQIIEFVRDNYVKRQTFQRFVFHFSIYKFKCFVLELTLNIFICCLIFIAQLFYQFRCLLICERKKRKEDLFLIHLTIE